MSLIASIKASFKLFLFLLSCLWITIIQSVVLLFTKGRTAYILPRIWHSSVCFIFGVRITVKGAPSKHKQTIYMSNHVSYLDILALGSVIPASFVSKSEVSGWPLFGYLATLQQTSFIIRSRTDAKAQNNSLQKRIAHGDSLIIFPEGTSTDGRAVIPFKSTLFALAHGVDDLYVQPVTIKIISANGKDPSDPAVRDIYAWHGDMELEPHVWALAKGKGASIEITFHDPILANDHENRKTLAKTTHETVCSAL